MQNIRKCVNTLIGGNSKIDFSEIAYLNKEKKRRIKISTDREELVDTTRLYWSVFDDTKYNGSMYLIQGDDVPANIIP